MKTQSPPAITATGLRKSFGDKVVLDGINLQVPEGTIFALLGRWRPSGSMPSSTTLSPKDMRSPVAVIAGGYWLSWFLVFSAGLAAIYPIWNPQRSG